MTEHLSPEILERLSQQKLKGAELLAALDHLEECEECRAKVISPSKDQLLETLFGDDDSTNDVDILKARK